MDFTTFMHGFAATVRPPVPATESTCDPSPFSMKRVPTRLVSRSSLRYPLSNELHRPPPPVSQPAASQQAKRRKAGGAKGDGQRAAHDHRTPPRGEAGGEAGGEASAGGARGRHQHQQERWESGEPLAGQSMVATAIICAAVLIALPLLRMLFRLLALVSLAALYLNNPARDSSTHSRCWDALLAERRRRIAERNSKDLSKFNVVGLFKNAFTDTAGLLQGQRVMVDFVFFSMAYLDSKADVDAEYFALGVMGSWMVVEMAALRKVAAGVATTLDNAATVAGVKD